MWRADDHVSLNFPFLLYRGRVTSVGNAAQEPLFYTNLPFELLVFRYYYITSVVVVFIVSEKRGMNLYGLSSSYYLVDLCP